MITYSVWQELTDFGYYYTNFEKIASYSIAAFITLITIPLDIVTFPFQIIGLIIFFIAKLIKIKEK